MATIDLLLYYTTGSLIGVVLGYLLIFLIKDIKSNSAERKFRRDLKKVSNILKREQRAWLTIEDIKKNMIFKINASRIKRALHVLCHTNPKYKEHKLYGFTYYQNIK